MAKRDQDTEARAARLTLPLNSDGFIDLDHMRPGSAARLIELIKTDPAIRQAYNEENGPPVDSDLFQGITEANVHAGLDILSQANALVFRMAASRFIKHPLARTSDGKRMPLALDMDIVNAAFKLTDEQHAELDPRATRIAQKYSGRMPGWMKDNMDLVMLGSMYLKYTATNAQTAIMNQIKRDVAKAQAAAAAAGVRDTNPKPDSDARPQTMSAQPTNGHDRTAPNPASYARDAFSDSVVDPAEPEAPTV